MLQLIWIRLHAQVQLIFFQQRESTQLVIFLYKVRLQSAGIILQLSRRLVASTSLSMEEFLFQTYDV